MVGGDVLIWPLEERERYLVTAEQVEARRRQWLDDRRERKLGGLRRIQAIGIDQVRVSTLPKMNGSAGGALRGMEWL